MLDERTHTKRGKWSEPGVPHRGWHCVDVEDLGEPSQLCQMCEGVDVRYVHHMQHADYPDVLAVGCVCAEHMEEDYAGPRRREERVKKAARRRASWARRAWNLSRKGNFYINAEGFNITIFRYGPGTRSQSRTAKLINPGSLIESTTRLTLRK